MGEELPVNGPELAEALADAVGRCQKDSASEMRTKILTIAIAVGFAFLGSWMGTQVAIAKMEASLQFQGLQITEVREHQKEHASLDGHQVMNERVKTHLLHHLNNP